MNFVNDFTDLDLLVKGKQFEIQSENVNIKFQLKDITISSNRPDAFLLRTQQSSIDVVCNPEQYIELMKVF